MDVVKEKMTKAADMAADTANSIEEVASNMLDKSSSNMEEFRDTIEDNPLYLALLGIVVLVLYLGIYFIYTRKPKRSDGEVRDSNNNSEAAGQAGNKADNYVDKAKEVVANIIQWFKDTLEWIKEAAATFREKDTGEWIKETADTFKEKFEKFISTAKDNPIYLGLIGVAVFVLSLGVYFIYTGDCDDMLDYVKEKNGDAVDMIFNIANWIKNVSINITNWIKEVSVNFATWIKEIAVNFANWIKEIVVNTGIWIKDVTVSSAIWIKEVAASSLDTVKENPVFFTLLMILVFVLCPVAYFVYTRQAKKKDGKVGTSTNSSSTKTSNTTSITRK